jgi:hypothetical protein
MEVRVVKSKKSNVAPRLDEAQLDEIARRVALKLRAASHRVDAEWLPLTGLGSVTVKAA